MAENNAQTTYRPGGVTRRGFRPGESGNPGGRPRGLAALVREAVSDGADLVALMTAVLKGDCKALGVRKVSLRDRMQAAEWLADRGFGKMTPVVDLPAEPPEVSLEDQLQAWAEQLPPALREQLGRYLDGQFRAKIDSEVARAEEAARAHLPPPPIDIRELQRNGDR